MYSERDFPTSRHKIILNRLACRSNQLNNWIVVPLSGVIVHQLKLP